jgi:hypothetical protein
MRLKLSCDFMHLYPLPPHPFGALCDRLRRVATAATKHDVARIKQRTTVLKFFDVVAKHADAGAARCLARRIFAASATLADDAGDQRSPFLAAVDGRRDLRSRRQAVGDSADAIGEHR